MAYKRQIDRLPIPPADANNVTCHYCIVGCGYKAYTWPRNKQGTPQNNAFGIDLSEQQAGDGTWVAPSMYNMVKQDGQDVHLVVVPDQDCVVNSGLVSIRGGRMAENRPSKVTGTQQRTGVWQPTSWEDALDLVARVTARIVNDYGEDELIVSMFDHGGSAGGYENTWATGKLYFESMKVKNCRIHNRPAYNSEVEPRHGRWRAEQQLLGLRGHRHDLHGWRQLAGDTDQPVPQPHAQGAGERRPLHHGRSAAHGYGACR